MRKEFGLHGEKRLHVMRSACIPRKIKRRLSLPYTDPEARGEVVLVAADAGEKVFPSQRVGKVEGGAPAPFVEERGNLVVGVHQLGVLALPLGLCAFCIGSLRTRKGGYNR